MTIHKAKTSAYDSVTNNGIYHYIRQYANQITKEVEPAEDGSGNDYKAKQAQFDKANRTQLKAIAAELETIVKRLDYTLHGRY
jgi:hypothetical protein